MVSLLLNLVTGLKECEAGRSCCFGPAETDIVVGVNDEDVAVDLVA